MAFGVLGGLQVGVGDVGNIYNAGFDVLVQGADLIHVHGEVAAHLEDVPHLVGSNQGLELGEIVVEGVVLVFDVHLGMQRFVQFNDFDGAVVALLGAPPRHAQGNGFAVGSRGIGGAGGGSRGAAIASGTTACQTYQHGRSKNEGYGSLFHGALLNFLLILDEIRFAVRLFCLTDPSTNND